MWIALYLAGGLLLAAAVAVAVILVTHVENWSRDLTTNVAATSDDAADSRLRTMESLLSPAELAAVVTSAAKALENWQLVSQNEAKSGVELHLIRTTGLMRYKDDIRVRIEPAGSGSRLSAESRSRVGKGDLGQNPRNLRELLGQVRAALD